MNFRTPIASALFALISASALAQVPAPAPSPSATAMPRVDARRAEQEKRIEQGKVSGSLTPHEAHRLQHEQRQIGRAELHAKADGVVTPKERQRLGRMQDKASHDIAREKHDAQTVPPAVGK